MPLNSTNSEHPGTSIVPAEPRPDAKNPATTVLPKTVTFDELASGCGEVLILHHGQQYRLRVTRNGGLILNK